MRGAIGFSSFAVLVYYAIANASAWTLRQDQGSPPRVVPALGLAGCLVLAFSLPLKSVIAGAAVLLLGAMLWVTRWLIHPSTQPGQFVHLVRQASASSVLFVRVSRGTCTPTHAIGPDGLLNRDEMSRSDTRLRRLDHHWRRKTDHSGCPGSFEGRYRHDSEMRGDGRCRRPRAMTSSA